VPADDREIQAALRAADDCWRKFPYFEARYGERGRRFARSDAAWLATLPRYEPEQILKQARWLGRVLAGRGMPTLLLEDQLESLAAELTAANPGERPAHEKLLGAAAALRASRGKHLTEEAARRVAGEFEHAVGPEWSARLPHTGALLAAAVADECESARGAVDALLPWMTDAARFPPAWIAAIHRALASARAACEARTP
jgi:hypothetical protein